MGKYWQDFIKKGKVTLLAGFYKKKEKGHCWQDCEKGRG